MSSIEGLFGSSPGNGFYGGKLQRLVFAGDDGIVRHLKLDEWYSLFVTHCSEKILKANKRNPFWQQVGKLPLCWGSNGGVPDMSGSLSVPSGVAEFYRWAEAGRYDSFPEMDKVIRAVHPVSRDRFYHNPRDPNNRSDLVAGDAFELFRNLFFPGHRDVFDFDQLYRTKDTPDGHTLYEYAVEAVRIVAQTVCHYSEINSQRALFNGHVLNLEQYKVMLRKAECPGVSVNNFPATLAMMRGFCSGDLIKTKSMTAYQIVTQILEEFLVDHTPGGRFPKGTPTGSSIYSTRYFTKKDQWDPFVDLTSLMMILMSRPTRQILAIFDNLSRKEGTPVEELDFRDLLVNKTWIFNYLDRNTGSKEHLDVIHLKIAAGILVANKEDALIPRLTFVQGQAKKKAEVLARSRGKETINQLVGFESDVENQIGSASDSETGENNDECAFKVGPFRPREFTRKREGLMKFEEFMKNSRLIVDRASHKIFRETGQTLSKMDFDRVNSGGSMKVCTIFKRPLPRRTNVTKRFETAMGKARKFTNKNKTKKFVAFELDEDGEPEGLADLMMAVRIEAYDNDNDDEMEEVEEDKFGSFIEGKPIGERNLDHHDIFRLAECSEATMMVGDGRKKVKKVFALEFCLNVPIGNKITKGKFRVLFDSGASVSLVPETFVAGYKNQYGRNMRIERSEPGAANTAGGGQLRFLPVKVSFELEVGELRISFNEARVHAGHSPSLLMSLTGMAENGISLINSVDISGYVGPPGMIMCKNGVQLEKFVPELRQMEGMFSFDLDDIMTSPIEATPTVGERCYHDSVIENMAPTNRLDPDGRRHYLRKIEKIHAELSKKNTWKECTVAAENEEFPPLEFAKDPERLVKKVWEIVENSKVLYSGTQGYVVGEEYEVTADIVGDTSPKSAPGSYGKNRPEHVEKAIIDKIDEEAAEGVVTLLPKGMVIKHYVNYFPVGKKNAETGKVEMSCGNIRVVADCARSGINKDTKHLARSTDSIRKVLQKVAPYTKKGFIAAIDITSMFYCFGMDKKIWPNFAIDHPQVGPMVYTRLPMGWISSPLLAKEKIAMILYEHIEKDRMQIYVDDIVIYGNTEEEFLYNLAAVFNTLARKNLRLKGKKCEFLTRDIRLLGRRVVNGVIKQSDHTLSKIAVEDENSLKTVKALKRFLGIVAYVSEALPYKTELLKDFYDQIKGKESRPSDLINWTPELVEKLRLLKEKLNMKTLTDLHPLEPHRKAFITVDSSNIGTGAFMYHMSDEGKPQIIRMFSRKRGDIGLRTQWSSCMLEINGILNAVLYFMWEIDSLKDPVTILTDSQSCKKLFDRCRAGKDLSPDKKLNERIIKLANLNVNIVYRSAKMRDLDLADFISRSERLLKPCTGNCSTCVELDKNGGMIKDRDQKKGLENAMMVVSSTIEMGLERFEDLFRVELNDPTFNEAYKRAALNEYKVDSFEENEYEIYAMVTRRRTRQLENRAKGPSKSFEARMGPAFDAIEKKTLSEIMEDKDLIREIQTNDRILNAIFKAKEEGLKPGPKERPAERLRTMTHTEDGVLKRSNIHVQNKVVSPIMIPDDMVLVFVKKIHESVGCGTATRLKNLARELIWGTNLAKFVEETTRKCKGCCYHRISPKIVKNETEYEDRCPDRIGEIFFVDIITRPSSSDRAKHPETSLKFYVITDALSSFMKIYPIGNKENNAEKGSKIIASAMAWLSRGPEKLMSRRIITDGSSVNQKIAKNPLWEDMNITFSLPDKLSKGKNYLSPLDSRVHKVSRKLAELIGAKHDPDRVACLAAEHFNTTVGAAGWSPFEIWYGRSPVTNKPVTVDLERLKSVVKEASRLSREAKERSAKKGRWRLPLELKPWEEGDEYGKDLASPIKVGDLVLIEGEFDKTDLNPFYEVTKLDWNLRVIESRRHGVRKHKPRKWHMNAIKAVVENSKVTESTAKELSFELHSKFFDPRVRAESIVVVPPSARSTLSTWEGFTEWKGRVLSNNSLRKKSNLSMPLAEF